MTCPISGTLMQIRFLVCNQWRCESIDHRPNSMRNQKLNVSALWDPRTSEHEIFTVQRNIHNKIIKSTYTIFLGADFPYFSLKSSDCKLVVSSRISSLGNVYIYIYMYKKHQPCKLCCPGLCEFCNLACPGLFWTLPRFNWTLLISRSGCHSEFHRILRLPRKVTVELQQILPLPGKLNVQFDCNFIKYCACHKQSTAPSVSTKIKCATWMHATSWNIERATKSRLFFDSTILWLYFSLNLLFFDSTILLLYYSFTLLLYFSLTLLFFYSTILLLYNSLTLLFFKPYYSFTLLFFIATILLLGDLVRISEVSQLNFLW